MKSALWIGLVAVTLMRWLCVWWSGPSPSEAYYDLCAARPAPAFFDGPPGTALLLRLAQSVAGFEAARFLWPLWAALVSILAWQAGRRMFGEKASVWGVVMLNALPVFHAQATQAGPGMPALACALGGLLAAMRAVRGQDMAWIAAGIFFAAGSLFSYATVLFAGGVALALPIFSQERFSPGALIALIFPTVLALAWPLAWNAGWDWIPIAGDTAQTWWRVAPGGLAENTAELIGAFSPTGMLVLVCGIGLLAVQVATRGRAQGRWLLAGGLACGLGGSYLWLLGKEFLPLAWLAFPAAGLCFFRALKGRWRLWAGVLAIAGGAVGSFQEARHIAGISRGWDVVARELHEAVRELPATGRGGFLIAETPADAAMLGRFFRAGEPSPYPPVFVPESPALDSQFGIWPSYADFVEGEADPLFTEQQGHNPFIGGNALYIGRDLPQGIHGAFSETREIAEVVLPGGRKAKIHLCLDYQTLPL